MGSRSIRRCIHTAYVYLNELSKIKLYVSRNCCIFVNSITTLLFKSNHSKSRIVLIWRQNVVTIRPLWRYDFLDLIDWSWDYCNCRRESWVVPFLWPWAFLIQSISLSSHHPTVIPFLLIAWMCVCLSVDSECVRVSRFADAWCSISDDE